MLALLNELRQALGWRGFAAILAVAVVSVLALDFTTNARSYFEMYIQSQNAQWAAVKAKADAERATSEAKKAEHEAVTAKALADKAEADARTAKQVAENAAQAQKGAAEKSEGEGKNAQAIGRYAEMRAAAEAREKAALAEKALWEAREKAGSATLNNAIIAAAGLPVPNIEAPSSTQASPAPTRGDPPGDLAARMTNCMVPREMRGGTPRPSYCFDNSSAAPAPKLDAGEAVRNLEGAAGPLKSPFESGRKPNPMTKRQMGEAMFDAAQDRARKLLSDEPAPVTPANSDTGGDYFRSNMALADRASGPPHTTPQQSGKDTQMVTGTCIKSLQGFRESPTPFGAFAAGYGGCGWAMLRDKGNARATALQSCASKGGQQCRVIAEK